eukprot:1161635-Pelagomonas_calceolata.AAC.4
MKGLFIKSHLSLQQCGSNCCSVALLLLLLLLNDDDGDGDEASFLQPHCRFDMSLKSTSMSMVDWIVHLHNCQKVRGVKGPSHPDGLHLRSYRTMKNGLEAHVRIPAKYCAFPVSACLLFR